MPVESKAGSCITITKQTSNSESVRSWTLSVERLAFSSEIALSHGTTSRISGQSYPRRQRIQNSARPSSVDY